MKRLMLALPLLLLIIPTSGQTLPTLGVSDGDSFTFVLESWDLNFQDEDATGIVFEDDNSTQSVVINEGESFTVTIIDATPAKNQWGDYQILIEYSAGGVTIQTQEWVDFGGFIVFPTWDEYRSEFESDASDFTDTDETSSIELIDTTDEFGYKAKYTYSYSDTDEDVSESNSEEIRYNKDDGVINYVHVSYKRTGTSYSSNIDKSGSATLRRQGYNLPNTSGGVSLPGFEFIWFTSLLLIPLIRKKY